MVEKLSADLEAFSKAADELENMSADVRSLIRSVDSRAVRVWMLFSFWELKPLICDVIHDSQEPLENIGGSEGFFANFHAWAWSDLRGVRKSRANLYSP